MVCIAPVYTVPLLMHIYPHGNHLSWLDRADLIISFTSTVALLIRPVATHIGFVVQTAVLLLLVLPFLRVVVFDAFLFFFLFPLLPLVISHQNGPYRRPRPEIRTFQAPS